MWILQLLQHRRKCRLLQMKAAPVLKWDLSVSCVWRKKNFWSLQKQLESFFKGLNPKAALPALSFHCEKLPFHFSFSINFNLCSFDAFDCMCVCVHECVLGVCVCACVGCMYVLSVCVGCMRV